MVPATARLGAAAVLHRSGARSRGLYNWPVVGWCVGTIKARNTDARFSKTIDSQREKVNFIIYYEVDDDNSKHALSLAAFGEDKDWVLLEKA